VIIQHFLKVAVSIESICACLYTCNPIQFHVTFSLPFVEVVRLNLELAQFLFANFFDVSSFVIDSQGTGMSFISVKLLLLSPWSELQMKYYRHDAFFRKKVGKLLTLNQFFISLNLAYLEIN
jgi:hypothetical protein